MKIPMLDLKREYQYMKTGIDAAIARCLEHQQWIFGPEVKEFEDRVAKYIGVKNCIGASSGTDALVLVLRALAISTKGQEYFDRSDLIITTPFTFTATGDAILRAGATPVFVDIDPVSYNIDPAGIRNFIELEIRNQKSEIKGILPVHLYGQPCQMDEIMSIAEENKLFVVEDVAQAFGGSWNGRKLGSIGTCGAFSFFPSKNLGGFGDGGMISTNDDALAELIRMLLKHGGTDKYNVNYIGYNARLDTLQAAILLAKFEYVEEFNRRRYDIARYYLTALKGLKDLRLPLFPESYIAVPPPLPASDPLAKLETASLSNGDSTLQHVFHQYTIRAVDRKRDALQLYLKSKGVSSMVYYPVPLHKMKVFEGKCKVHGELAETSRAIEQVLSLPIEPLMEDWKTGVVTEAINGFFS